MAVYRQIQITFWQDPFLVELPAEEKYFYIYLLTNSKTTQCGIYEISERVMELETGLTDVKVSELLNKFTSYKKIEYDSKTKEIFILNWLKFNPINNKNIEKCILKELKNIKQQNFINIFLTKCIGLQFVIPNIKEAYKGLIRGLIENNGAEAPPCKQKEEEEEEKKEEKKEKEKEQKEEQKKSSGSGADVGLISSLSHFLEKCNFIISPMLIEKLISDIGIYSQTEVYKAIEISDSNGKRTYSYIKGVLERRRAEGDKGKPNNKEKLDQMIEGLWPDEQK